MTKNTLTYKLITGTAAICKAIDSIATRGKRLDRDIQVAALSAMQHHVEHGDTTLINRLVESMPKGSRVNALRTYIETFGAVIYDQENKRFAHSKSKTFRLDDAMQVLWTEFKPETEYQSITDPMQLVKQLTQRLETDIANMGDKSKVDPAMIAQLKAMTAPEVMH